MTLPSSPPRAARIEDATGFQARAAAGIRLNDLFRLFLNGRGRHRIGRQRYRGDGEPDQRRASDVVSAS